MSRWVWVLAVVVVLAGVSAVVVMGGPADSPDSLSGAVPDAPDAPDAPDDDVVGAVPSAPDDTVADQPAPTTAPAAADCVGSARAKVAGIGYVPGGDPLQSLDVVGREMPDGCAGAPVVVWVHGGGWQRGSKNNVSADQLAWAADNGWVHVSVDYRLTPAVTYPEHNRDLAAALAWVHDNIADHGGDPTTVAVVGHSAGAQIASSVGTDPRYLAVHGLVPGDGIRCVVSLDTEGYDLNRGGSSAVYSAAFGMDAAVRTDASPVTHLRGGSPRANLLVVTRGSAARRSIATDFVDRHNATGGNAILVVAEGLSHTGVNEALGRDGDTVVTPPSTSFLRSCFGDGNPTGR